LDDEYGRQTLIIIINIILKVDLADSKKYKNNKINGKREDKYY